MFLFKKKKKEKKEKAVKKEKAAKIPEAKSLAEGTKKEKKALPKRKTEKREQEREKSRESAKSMPEQKQSSAYAVLRSFHIAEKPESLMDMNQYVFKVSKKANKNEIKKAVEESYGVNVLKVRIINVPAKRRRLGRTRGWKKGYKKAIVTLKEGQKIEVVPK